MRTYLDLLHDPKFRLPLEIEKQTIGARQFPLWAGPEGWQTACHNPSVIDAILTGHPYPVRAMYISGVNIAVTYPDSARTIEALQSLDFLAVASQTMTPTAVYADIVLPKTTTLEEEEVQLQPGAPCVSYTRALVVPRGEARCDLDIALGLRDRPAARRALSHVFLPWPTMRAFNEYLLGDSGISITGLAKTGFAVFPYTLGDFEVRGFATATGKVELYSPRLAALGLDPLPGYTPPRAARESQAVMDAFPLVLLTGIREKSYHHSRFRDLPLSRKVSPHPTLQIHPDTAAAHNVADAQWVAVRTPGMANSCRGPWSATAHRRASSPPAWAGGTPTRQAPIKARSTSISTARSPMRVPGIRYPVRRIRTAFDAALNPCIRRHDEPFSPYYRAQSKIGGE